MKIFIWIAISVLCASCNSICYNKVYSGYLQEIQKEFIECAVKKEGLIPYGVGEASLGDIQEVMFHFIKIGEHDIPKARILIVSQAERLLRSINGNTTIRPYLHDFPFTSENILVNIFFKPSLNDYYRPPILSGVFVTNGKIFYDYSPEKCIYRTAFKETYETALEWVKEHAPWVLTE